MICTNLISKALNVGRLFLPHNSFYIPLANVTTKTTAIQLPERPKKPLTAFFRFVQEHKTVLHKEHPELKLTELVKRCAEDWKNVHPTVKERYNSEYKSDMEVYAQKHLDYSMKLTDEQKEYIKQMNKEKLEISKKRKIKKKMKGMNKPKRPVSAFLLYLLDQSKIKGKNISELMKDMKGAWHLLDESEKAAYIQKAELLKVKYREDLEKWETQMIHEGHTDIVRSKILKNLSESFESHIPPISKKKPKSSQPKEKNE